MFDDFVDNLGYEMERRINIYMMLPGMQMNEDGLRLMSKNRETNSIRSLVKEGHNYLMFYVDHDDSISGEKWDDVIANPTAHPAPMLSPMKSKKEDDNNVEQSIVVVEESTVEEKYAGGSNVEGLCKASSRANIEDDEDLGSESDSDDSNHVLEIVDSDYDLEDGDDGLI